MDENTRNFIGNFLKLEMYDDIKSTRDGLQYMSPAIVEQVRVGMAKLIKNREMTEEEYGDLTLVAFPSEDAIYDYLQRVYNYLFEGGTEEPYPPEA